MVSIPYTDTHSPVHCTHDYFIHATGLFVLLYDEQFSSYTPFLEKYTEWPQMTLTSSRSKYQYACYIHARGPNFSPFCSMMSNFSVKAKFLEKCTKWPWHVQRQKYQHACYIHHRGPNFCTFRSMMSRFGVTPLFSEECTEWPQMTLPCSRSKYQHACYIHPRGPYFHQFRYTMSLRENF